MKKTTKKVFAMSLLAIVLMMVLMGCRQEEETVSPGVTLENYEQIQVGDKITGAGGTSYDTVLSLFDSEPNLKGELEKDGRKIVHVRWDKEESGKSDYHISVDFVDGKVSGKGQHGFGE